MEKIKALFKETGVLLRSVPSILLTFFVASVILMNLFANKSININLDFVALDAGFFISWISFLFMDILTKRFGPKAATIVSIIALLINLLFSFIFIGISYIPGVWSESYVEGSEDIINSALDKTFRGAWFIILGSSVAFIISAIINIILNHLIGKALKKDNFIAFALRSYVSTFIGQFTDNVLFAFIVSHTFFGWSITECIGCALVGAIFELVMEIIFSPLGYRLLRKMDEHNVGIEYLNLYGDKK